MESLRKRKIAVGYLDSETSRHMRNDFSLVFMSPEMLFGNWRNESISETISWTSNDEAHFVVKW